jgi:hypothetical protein
VVVRSGDDGLLLLASATSFWQVAPFRWDMFPVSIPWPMTEPPLSGDVHSILSSHHHGHQNGQQSGFIFIRYFVCCRPDTEQVAARWRLPGASGCSPGHAVLGDVRCIASLAGNVADMSRHVRGDTTCRSNFGQMGPCRRHKI